MVKELIAQLTALLITLNNAMRTQSRSEARWRYVGGIESLVSMLEDLMIERLELQATPTFYVDRIISVNQSIDVYEREIAYSVVMGGVSNADTLLRLCAALQKSLDETPV